MKTSSYAASVAAVATAWVLAMACAGGADAGRETNAGGIVITYRHHAQDQIFELCFDPYASENPLVWALRGHGRVLRSDGKTLCPSITLDLHIRTDAFAERAAVVSTTAAVVTLPNGAARTLLLDPQKTGTVWQALILDADGYSVGQVAVDSRLLPASAQAAPIQHMSALYAMLTASGAAQSSPYLDGSPCGGCTPSFEDCYSAAQVVCDIRGVQSVNYQCTCQSVTCQWTCGSGGGGK